MQVFFGQMQNIFITESIKDNTVLLLCSNSQQGNEITIQNNKIFNQQNVFLNKVQSLLSHSSSVYAICQMQDDLNVVATGSDDKTIKIWNVLTSQCIATLEGHLAYVRCLKVL